MNIFLNSKKYKKYTYTYEDEFEKDIIDNSKTFFGENTIYIDAKKKLESKTLGGTIPDGFFLDLRDEKDPQFYLVEVELARHDFFGHIFPQVTKFFAFYNNHKQRKALTESLFEIFEADNALKKALKKMIGGREIYKFLCDLVDSSQNILLVVDGELNELPEIMDTYSDTWGKIVRPLKLQKFINGKELIFSMDPEFEYIDLIDRAKSVGSDVKTEAYHLGDVQKNVKEIYRRLKSEVKKIDKKLIFNPQKHYISIKGRKNIAFIKLRKKKIRLVVMLKVSEIKKLVKKHKVNNLSESIQNFYNGECAVIEIEDVSNFNEVSKVIKGAYNSAS